MVDPLKKILEPIKELQNIRGIELPIGLEFLQLVVTGPPGAGKSFYIEQIRGWPNEGYLDMSKKGWWKNQSLIYRPREIHLGLPFHGFKEALTVFDQEWLSSTTPLEIEYPRIKIPAVKNNFFQTNWRDRYIFEFLIPPPSTIFSQRLSRKDHGYFPVDENLSLEMVKQQVAVYRDMALYLHRAGLNIYVRKSLDKPPMRIAEKGVINVPRWTLNKKPGRPGLKTFAGWKCLFRRHYPIKWITITKEPQALLTSGRIAHDGKSFELLLGDTKLRLQPEIPIGSKKHATNKNWLINTELGCSARTINGFIRIRVGETVVIGKTNKEYNELFNFSQSVASRHVSVTNRKGDLILTPLEPEYSTKIVRLDDLDYRERLERGRLNSLRTILRIYGQQITPLPPLQALQSIKVVNSLLRDESYREKDEDGKPGGLVELPAKLTPVIVGDLHAMVNNLLKILSESCLLDCLRMNTACLIILGDAVHSEIVNEMEKFDTSMLMMDLIFRLKCQFPANVFYIRGNHDSFAADINKNGIAQGTLFEEMLLKNRGARYVHEMNIFYNSLPYIICSDGYIACHAGPPRGSISKDELINIRQNKEIARQLMKIRIQRPHYPSGYTKGDVKKLRKALKLSPKSRLIVGHTPMDPFGSFWLHAGTIKNHHIIYSAHIEGPSVFIRSRKKFLPISYPAEPLDHILNDLKAS